MRVFMGRIETLPTWRTSTSSFKLEWYACKTRQKRAKRRVRAVARTGMVGVRSSCASGLWRLRRSVISIMQSQPIFNHT